MDLLGNIIILVVSAIVGGFIGSGIKPGGKGLTSKELWQHVLATLVPGAIFGAIAGILLSLFAVISMGINGLVGTVLMMVSGAFAGALLFGLITAIKDSLVNMFGEKNASTIAGIIGGLVLGVFIIFFIMPAGGSAYLEYWKVGLVNPISKGYHSIVKDIPKWMSCFQADPRCPFYIDWSDPVVQNHKESLEVSVGFKENQIKQDKINILAEISLTNPEKFELKLTPSCYLGKEITKSREISMNMLGQYAQGFEFVFPMSSETLSTSLRCSSDVPECKDKNVCLEQFVFLVLERLVRLEGNWPICIGERATIDCPKLAKTELKFNAPFSVTLYSNNDMPFDQGKTYDFQLAIKQLDESTELKNIELIRLTFPQDILASCEHFTAVGHELELRNVDKNWLGNNTQYDSGELKYTIPCSLNIKEAPIDSVRAPIEVEADYYVTSTFSQRIVKQP
jgi:hypothetical protein